MPITRAYETPHTVYGVAVSSWRRSRVVAVATIGIFLAVQLAIPISRYGEVGRAQRFGWQMFSIGEQAPRFVVETNAGEREIDLGDYMARVRGDIDIVGLMPAHLCGAVSGAVRVTWQDGVHRC